MRTPQEYGSLMREDQQLSEDTLVTVYWTSSHRYYRATGRVVKLNKKTVNVALCEDVPVPGWDTGYPTGQIIQVPRLANLAQWSPNNCVRLTS